jgi:hypothetical protein
MTERVITGADGRKYITTEPLLNQGSDYERGFIDGMQKQMQSSVDRAVNAMAQPAPVQEPVGYLFQHEETGLTTVVDVQQVEWGFEKNNPRHQKIGPVYTTPPAQQAVPDAIHPNDFSETPEYIQGWNDCRSLMLEMRKP